MAIPFIPEGSIPAGVIQSILDTAGQNFTAPYDASLQPVDTSGINSEDLLQFQLPAGASLRPYAEAGGAGTWISTAINSLLTGLAPIVSAYALLLPILGVIRGIIEILCCLMNPFCVVPAIIRFFTKWIPPFISIFPPFAAVVFIASVIKIILAIVFYVMVVVVPTIELILDNINSLVDEFSKIADKSPQKLLAIDGKLGSVLRELFEKIGIFDVFLPLAELIFLILGLQAGVPCDSGNSEREPLPDLGINAPVPTEEQQALGSLGNSPFDFDTSEPDSSCCEGNCPDVISENPPSGSGILITSGFADCEPSFIYRLITTNPKVSELEQFSESFDKQLNCQLDEPIDRARPHGSDGDRSLLKVKLTKRRGGSSSITLPVLKVEGNSMYISGLPGFLFLGSVSYEVIPDYELLILEGILNVGCHPDVAKVKKEVGKVFGNANKSALENNPELVPFLDNLNDVVSGLKGNIQNISDAVSQISDFVNDVSVTPAPPFTDQVSSITQARDDIVANLNAYAVDLVDTFNSLINNNADLRSSYFEVDRNTVRSNGDDTATIKVFLRDVAGSILLKDAPNGVIANVDIENDFGVVDNKRIDTAQGAVLADISSTTPGPAEIKVKFNNDYILVNNGDTEIVQTETVRFIVDDTLPKKRKGSKFKSSDTIEKPPGAGK